MKLYLNLALAIIAGVVIGGIVNMAIVMIGPHVIAPPPGIDMSSAESMAANSNLLEPRHYLFPLIAHALGTYTGALAAYAIAKEYKAIVAIIIGFLFFFTFCGVLLWYGSRYAWSSLIRLEPCNTPFRAPLYPIKMIIPIGALLIILQELANLCRNIHVAITGKSYEH